jgi:hypothetical protein
VNRAAIHAGVGPAKSSNLIEHTIPATPGDAFTKWVACSNPAHSSQIDKGLMGRPLLSVGGRDGWVFEIQVLFTVCFVYGFVLFFCSGIGCAGWSVSRTAVLMGSLRNNILRRRGDGLFRQRGLSSLYSLDSLPYS